MDVPEGGTVPGTATNSTRREEVMGHLRWRFTAPLFVAALAVPAALAGGGVTSSASSAAAKAPTHIDCSNTNRFICTEVRDSQAVFGHYVGHDEPSVLFYSNKNGSGNRDAIQRHRFPRRRLQPTSPASISTTFEYTPAFWFGMAMCDTPVLPGASSTRVFQTVMSTSSIPRRVRITPAPRTWSCSSIHQAMSSNGTASAAPPPNGAWP